MMPGPPAVPRSLAAPPAASDGVGWCPRLRRFLVASVLGAAVVVWPAWPTAAHERSARRPAFERALSWREFIRLRLSPWLLLQEVRERIERDPPLSDQG